MERWKTLPYQIPVDGSIVWVRLNYWFGAPFKAQWNEFDGSFISVVNSISYPHYTISRWRNL